MCIFIGLGIAETSSFGGGKDVAGVSNGVGLINEVVTEQ